MLGLDDSADPRRPHRGLRTSNQRGSIALDAETRLFFFTLGGVVLAALGLLWLIVAAFRVKWPWGVAVVLFLPIALPLFVFRHLKPSARPLAIIAAGLAIGLGPIAYNRLMPVDLGPYEKVVGDELHLTLTGWDRADYSILEARPATVVLQMANPDVTDSTLAYLRGMSRLRELDLSGTGVDDEGLKELEPLSKLESLRLKGTKVTDEGFQRWLQPREALKQLDLRGTAVTKETGKAWRDAKPGRRLLQ